LSLGDGDPANTRENHRAQSVDVQTEEKIHEAMRQLDAAVDVVPPHLSHLQRMVVEHQRYTKIRLIRALMAFWAVAICILLLLILLFYQAPNGFLEVQIVAVALTIALGWLRRQKVVEDQ
jgi:ABC-type phosphate/phosphonate transport system permease subunit